MRRSSEPRIYFVLLLLCPPPFFGAAQHFNASEAKSQGTCCPVPVALYFSSSKGDFYILLVGVLSR